MPLRRSVVFVICFMAGLAAAAAQTPSFGLNASDLFEKGMNALEGSSATQNGVNAIDYFRRSADLGFAPAQVVLGYFYETGRFTAADPQQALQWYKKSALQDDPLAQWLAGRSIYMGVTARDLNEAASWFEKASAHDDPFAEYLLGKIFLDRNDYSHAAECFRKAAQQGLPQAQRHLALLLRDGQGVAVDRYESYVWLLVSSDTGHRPEKLDVQALEGQLSSSQVERAKSEARLRQAKTNRSVVAHGCTGWHGEFDEIPPPPPPELQRFCR